MGHPRAAIGVLSPKVAEALLHGHQPARIDTAMLLARGAVNARWDAQERLLAG